MAYLQSVIDVRNRAMAAMDPSVESENFYLDVPSFLEHPQPELRSRLAEDMTLMLGTSDEFRRLRESGDMSADIEDVVDDETKAALLGGLGNIYAAQGKLSWALGALRRAWELTDDPTPSEDAVLMQLLHWCSLHASTIEESAEAGWGGAYHGARGIRGLQPWVSKSPKLGAMLEFLVPRYRQALIQAAGSNRDLIDASMARLRLLDRPAWDAVTSGQKEGYLAGWLYWDGTESDVQEDLPGLVICYSWGVGAQPIETASDPYPWRQREDSYYRRVSESLPTFPQMEQIKNALDDEEFENFMRAVRNEPVVLGKIIHGLVLGEHLRYRQEDAAEL